MRLASAILISGLIGAMTSTARQPFANEKLAEVLSKLDQQQTDCKVYFNLEEFDSTIRNNPLRLDWAIAADLEWFLKNRKKKFPGICFKSRNLHTYYSIVSLHENGSVREMVREQRTADTTTRGNVSVQDSNGDVYSGTVDGTSTTTYDVDVPRRFQESSAYVYVYRVRNEEIEKPPIFEDARNKVYDAGWMNYLSRSPGHQVFRRALEFIQYDAGLRAK